MKTSTIHKGLVLLALASASALGCELIVDFDRSRIPTEGVDGALLPVDTGAPEPEPEPEPDPDGGDAGDAGEDAGDAGEDAGDAGEEDAGEDAG